ncbi:ABC transporter substrate-binding protein [Rhizobacter sp. J219]|uniref:ABC transporter substrate-binding protein n=1 Tax=Rhizobacter sp. J219 TaxID=2898430 RepID=UPI002151F76C|nr:ABC transporter substrate-binding protein [Rhizobacter sp. J219]
MTNSTPLSSRRRALAAAAVLTLAPAWSCAQGSAPETPQPGGTLNIGTLVYTLNAGSFDPADWSWKLNNDLGLTYEQLIVADLSKARSRGGPHRFIADAWLPHDGMRGELAERWRLLDNPLRAEFELRKGIMFPAKPGVMEARELTAEDVVFSFNRINQSPKKIPGYFDHVAKVEATGKHTVVFTFKNYNSEWDYRFGWGYYSAIVPKEVVAAGAGNWKNVNGTGPFMLTDYIQGNSSTFTRNPNYWDKEKIGNQEHKLPFVDKISYRVIKEEATALTALRTGKLDVLELVSWSAIDELKKTAPKLKTSRWLGISGTVIGMRVDTKPFDDVRVRRALNMAIDKQAIIKGYYGGNAEMFVHPQHPDYTGYYEPLSAMPASIQDSTPTTPRRRRSSWPTPATPMASSSRCRSAATRRTTTW